MIRPARVEDVAAICAMLHEAAVEQGFPNAVGVTEADLASDGFGPEPHFSALIAEVDGTPAGMAVYFLKYSTWGSRMGLYLEDLFVRAEFRRRGIARALLTQVAQIADDRGCGRFEWVVNQENTGAIRLYESVGAKMLTEWRVMSLKGEAIRRLAKSKE